MPSEIACGVPSSYPLPLIPVFPAAAAGSCSEYARSPNQISNKVALSPMLWLEDVQNMMEMIWKRSLYVHM